MQSAALVYVLITVQVASIGLVLYLLLRIYLTLRQDQERLASTSVPIAPATLQRNVADLIAELRKTADQVNHDLAVNSATLREQIDEATRTIALLDEALQRASGAPPSDAGSHAVQGDDQDVGGANGAALIARPD